LDTNTTITPRKRAAPRWRRRKDTRPTEIVTAALEIFGERGYDATRIEDVGRSAGCTKGTVFLYFENKAELFKAAVRASMLPLLTEAERTVGEQRGSSRELLSSVLRLRWEHMIRNRLTGLVKLVLTETVKYPELARFYHDEFIGPHQRLLEKVLRTGIERREFRAMDVEHVARLVISPMLFAAVWRHSFEPAGGPPLALDPYFETALDVMLAGLSTVPVTESATG
jgi:AcrR family transcriptional regulator